ncbi:MAG: SCO family protein, partial [Candidatus Eisenbacteria bacterium]
MAVLRLTVMAVLVGLLMAGRLGWMGGFAGRARVVSGSAGRSSGSAGISEEQAASSAPASSGAELTRLAGHYRDASGAELTLASLRGRPFVASVLYTRCTTVCPRIVAALQRLARDAGEPSPHFVLFSLDPVHDTPESLAVFARTHELDPEHWTLLVSEPGALPPLAAALGVAWQPGPDGG